MATVFNSGIYPPVIDAYMPAFIIGHNCRIYMSISQYNIFAAVKSQVQVSVRDRQTNKNVIKTKEDIILKELLVDETINTDTKYYIELSNDDINFELLKYYKVQIRFTHADAPARQTDEKLSAWIYANKNYFSEWSTVCLIHPISDVSLDINNDLEEYYEGLEPQFLGVNYLEVLAKLNFDNENETEYLRSYKIELYDNDSNILIESSGEQYSNSFSNYNQIQYKLKTALVSETTTEKDYRLEIFIETNNKFSKIFKYTFTPVKYNTENPPVSGTAELSKESDCININISYIEGNDTVASKGSFLGNYVIQRADSKHKYQIWDDIYTYYESSDLNSTGFTFKDYSFESGTGYSYRIAKKDYQGYYSNPVYITKSSSGARSSIVYEFEDLYLLDANNILTFKYDVSVSNFKRNVPIVKTDTIGSKYPFFKKNSMVDYRSFSLNGIITMKNEQSKNHSTFSGSTSDSLMGHINAETNGKGSNSNHTSISVDGNTLASFELANKNSNFLNSIIQNNLLNNLNLNKWNEERYFREAVMDFLYNGEAKLFKTETEGNMIVILTDVNLTPKEQLGRQIYSFTANVCEIDDYSIENLNKYGIQKCGEYIPYEPYQKRTVLGQIYDTSQIRDFNSDTEIVQGVILNKYSKEGTITNIPQGLSYVKIEFQSVPYFIDDNKDFYGYRVRINGKDVLINEEGIYVLNNPNFIISSITFPDAEKVSALIDYIVDYEYVTKEYRYKSRVNRTCCGQISDYFTFDRNLTTEIRARYYHQYEEVDGIHYQLMTSVNGVKISAEPGTAFMIKDAKDTLDKDVDANMMVMNPTGVYEFYYTDNAVTSQISKIYIYGKQMFKATVDEIKAYRKTGYLNYNKYVLKSDFETNCKDRPLNDKIGYLDGEVFHFRGKTYGIDAKTGYIIVKMPVYAMIDYIGEVQKGIKV